MRRYYFFTVNLLIYSLFLSLSILLLNFLLIRSAAPSQIGIKVSAKRKCSSDDEKDENRKLKSSNICSNQWIQFREQLKKNKKKDIDNYDATKFVSKYRQPLVDVPANTTKYENASKTLPLIQSSNSHVIKFL